MDEAAIHAHVEAINRCNQRGGRMLSLVDLIEAVFMLMILYLER